MPFKMVMEVEMTKVIETEKFTVRIHGEVNKEQLLTACKKYCEKVDVKKGKDTNDKTD